MNVSEMIDPEIARAVASYPIVTLTKESLPLMRARVMPSPQLSGDVLRRDHSVPGEPEVVVRVHRPVVSSGPLPCVVSIHGGGYVLGSYATDDLRFDRWCTLLGIVGVSVNYRLAPETPYPGPLEDCYAALQWTYESAGSLGVDRERIGLHGLSAGGGLAAALTLLARDRGDVPVAFALLDSPMLDDRQRTISIQRDGLAIWSKESNQFGWMCYLGEIYGSDDVPYHAVPSRASDLSGLPPTFISVGALDGFRDEDVDYAMRLIDAGVPTDLHVYAGAPHGYQLAGDTKVGRQARRDAEEWLARQIARPGQ